MVKAKRKTAGKPRRVGVIDDEREDLERDIVTRSAGFPADEDLEDDDMIRFPPASPKKRRKSEVPEDLETQLPLEGMDSEVIPEIEGLALVIERADAALKIARAQKDDAVAMLIKALSERGITQYKGGGRIVSLVFKSDGVAIKKVTKAYQA